MIYIDGDTMKWRNEKQQQQREEVDLESPL